MENGIAFALVAAIALLLAFGCAGLDLGAALDETPPAPKASGSEVFSLPQSPVSYTVHYRVTEGAAQSEKTVYRTEDKMRVDVGADGQVQLSLYFAGGKIYSCPRLVKGSCIDVTANLPRSASALFSHGAMPSGAKYDSETDIGGTVGKCYVAPYNLYGTRKVCYTDQGVVAYDEYPINEKTMHVEYATQIHYGAGVSDFLFSVQK